MFYLAKVKTFIYGKKTTINFSPIHHLFVSKTPDDMHRFTIFGGLSLNQSEPRLDLAATYLIPGRLQLGLNLVPVSSYGADAFFFFAPTEKERAFKIYLASRQYKRDTTTLYVTEEIILPKRFFAIHAGYERYNYNYPVNQAAVGLAMSKFTHYRIVIHEGDDRSKIKTNQFTLGVDALLYPGKKVGEELWESKNEKVVTPVGAKAFYEYRSSLSGTKDWGMYIRISVEYDLAGNVTPKGAVGFFGGF